MEAWKEERESWREGIRAAIGTNRRGAEGIEGVFRLGLNLGGGKKRGGERQKGIIDTTTSHSSISPFMHERAREIFPPKQYALEKDRNRGGVGVERK